MNLYFLGRKFKIIYNMLYDIFSKYFPKTKKIVNKYLKDNITDDYVKIDNVIYFNLENVLKNQTGILERVLNEIKEEDLDNNETLLSIYDLNLSLYFTKNLKLKSINEKI